MQDGHALQHKPQAAEPQQQATFAAQVAAEHTPKTAPILSKCKSTLGEKLKLLPVKRAARHEMSFEKRDIRGQR